MFPTTWKTQVHQIPASNCTMQGLYRDPDEWMNLLIHEPWKVGPYDPYKWSYFTPINGPKQMSKWGYFTTTNVVMGPYLKLVGGGLVSSSKIIQWYLGFGEVWTPQKAEPQEVFGGPLTPIHKALERLGYMIDSYGKLVGTSIHIIGLHNTHNGSMGLVYLPKKQKSS